MVNTVTDGRLLSGVHNSFTTFTGAPASVTSGKSSETVRRRSLRRPIGISCYAGYRKCAGLTTVFAGDNRLGCRLQISPIGLRELYNGSFRFGRGGTGS